MIRVAREIGWLIISPVAGNRKRPHFAAGGHSRELPFDPACQDARLYPRVAIVKSQRPNHWAFDAGGNFRYVMSPKELSATRARVSNLEVSMKSRALSWAVRIVVVLIVAVGAGALAQAPAPSHFSGLVHDYTPETIGGVAVGPWVMSGTWSLDLNRKSGLAVFSAAMTMEHSDYAIVDGVDTADDPGNSDARAAHTHHITMKDATVSYDTSTCPAYPAPTAITNPGFMVTGPAYISGNGSPAPFSKNNTVLSTLQVCVNGGTDVPFSNVTLVFGSPASGHFGTQAIHGVVRKWE